MQDGTQASDRAAYFEFAQILCFTYNTPSFVEFILDPDLWSFDCNSHVFSDCLFALQALRMDPDSAACRTGIKRLRSLTSAKEAGNEAFKQGRWADAHERYSAAVAIDPQLRSSFVAQCFCNRSAL